MATETWNIDNSHSSVVFTVRHMVFAKVHGSFAKFQGKIEVGSEDLAHNSTDLPNSSAEVRIDASSIETREAQRDGHLKSPDFLDVAQFPEIVFTSKKVERKNATDLTVTGDLTIHGVTREAVLATEYTGSGKDPWGNQRIGFSAKTSIDRKEFGLHWNQLLEAGGLLVGEKIEITLDIQAIKAIKAAVVEKVA